MFYRFIGDRRKVSDLENIYSGDSIFLLGGHPSLVEEDLSQFQRPGVVTMAMNNTATIVKPTFWICADPPTCYSKSIIKDPSVVKFARLNYTNTLIDGKMWKDYSNTYFYGSSDKVKHDELLHINRFFAWWKNIFVIAVQTCYYLGFRHIYTLGCSFNIDNNMQYSYKTNLDEGQVKYNSQTYDMIIKQLSKSKDHIKNMGLKITSCTHNSKLNPLFGYMKFDDALEEVLRDYPVHDTLGSKHSSTFGKK